MKVIVDNKSEIPVPSGVQTPCNYPRSDEERMGEDAWAETSKGEGMNYTDTD